jgi:MFS family permease
MRNRFRDRIAARAGYKYYVLMILVLVYAINIMDRQVLALLLEDIKLEFALTDTQLGLLGGVAFAFFYSVMGIPLARWSDLGNRKTVLTFCLLFWSIATALCGFAVGFLTLIAARIGTAIGEAGGSPTSHAMIASCFTAKERATALAVFALGVPLGSIIGNLASGWLNEYLAWRSVFIAVGVPGIIVALLTYCSLHEPEQAHQLPDQSDLVKAQVPALPDSLRYLWSQKSYVHMCLAAGLHSVVWYAGSTWNASFLIRSHGLGTGEAGSWIASFALVGLLGTFFGGFLADRFAVRYRDQRWYLWLPGIAIVLSIPFQFLSYLSDDLTQTIFAFWIMTIFAATFFGPSYAVSQALAQPQTRALASSILIFVQTLIGLGVGPFLVGIISDYLAPAMANGSLRYALVAVGLVNVWSAYHYFEGSKSYREDLAAGSKVSPMLLQSPQAVPAAQIAKDHAQFI